ncbi:methyltransferase domain-containing protein [Botrytis cinerea]
MEIDDDPKTTPSPNSYLVEELGSYVDAGEPELDSENDADSALGGMSLRSSNFTVESEFYRHIEENGRTYHRYKHGQYPLPNDAVRSNLVEFQHRFLRMTIDGKLCVSPIDTDRPINVLDVATGTGIWAVEFADEYPNSTVIGTDLSPIQPHYIPTNCSFRIEDAEDPWKFDDLKFDLIHGRALLTCFRSPKTVIASAFQALAPGGYLELRDPIFPFKYASPPPENCALVKWNNMIVEASTRAGRPWTNGAHYKKWMEESGFVDIVERREYAPMSPWAKGQRNKVLSVWVQRNILMGLEGLSMALFTRVLGMEKEQVNELLIGVRADIENTKIHCYSEGVLVYGRKP